MTTTAPRPDHDQALTDAVARLENQLARCDSKASLLLALTGALLAGLTSAAPDIHLPLAAVVPAGLAVAALAAATLMLLLAVRPHVGGDDRSSWPHWARLTAQEIREQLADDRRPDQVRVLSGIAARKYGAIRTAVHLIITGLAALLLAALLAAVVLVVPA